MKKIIYIVLSILISLLIFFKPLSIYFLEKSLSHSLKRDVTISSFEFYPLKLDARIRMRNFPAGIEVHAEYAGGLSLTSGSIGKFIITSNSLGGLITIDYEHYIYNIRIDAIDFKKLAQVLADKKYVQSGIVNGKIVYHKKKKEGNTDLKVTEVVLNTTNIDQTIKSLNAALKLDMMSLFSQNFSMHADNNSKTHVDHLQFDIGYKNKIIIAKDVALRTNTYRISLTSSLDKKGNIDYFYINLLDKNGCALIKQALSGNVRKKPKKKISPALQNVMQASPKSFFGMGKQMMQYGSNYAGQQTGMKAQTNQMSSFMINESDQMFKNTSNMLLNDCKVIYNGKVKHPQTQDNQTIQTGEVDSSMLYQKELLL